MTHVAGLGGTGAEPFIFIAQKLFPINESSLGLATVTGALPRQEKHVPYRYSKLTKRLIEGLRGGSRILADLRPEGSFCLVRRITMTHRTSPSVD